MSDTNKPNTIHWPSIITVISAAILIGAEVFGQRLPAAGRSASCSG